MFSPFFALSYTPVAAKERYLRLGHQPFFRSAIFCFLHVRGAMKGEGGGGGGDRANDGRQRHGSLAWPSIYHNDF